MKLSNAIALVVGGLACATAQAQVTTDDCAAATLGITGPGTLQWDNSAATTGAEGQAEASCYAFGTSGIDADVWTIYTAAATGCAEVTTCNSGGTISDSKIAAYPGTACPTPGSSLACNDDTCGLLSTISFPVTAGQSYLLQLGNFPGAAPGTAQIDITEVPSGGGPALSNQDDCANGAADNVGPGQYSFSTLGATTGAEGQAEANCYFFGQPGIDNDIWFTYTATQDGCTTIATCNSDQPCATFLDTKVAVYPAAGCPTPGSSLACNDDACNGLRSTVLVQVTAGTSYLVQVGSFPGAASGTGLIDITEVACPTFLSNQDDCANAAIDTIGPGQYGWNNLGATTGIEGQNEASCYAFGTSGIQSDIWAVYVPEVDGSVTVTSCGSIGNSNGDTKIAAYPDAPCASIDNTSVACNDDTCGLLSEIVFNVQCGQSYLLQLGSFPGSGDGTADLFINESGSPCGPGPIGTPAPFCDPNSATEPALPNSTGAVATIRAQGQTAAAAMDVTVIAEGVPPSQFGYFFASQTLGYIPAPGGSNGNICVLGNQGRYNMGSQIGQGPTFSLDVGAIDVPTNPSGQPILMGETWYWQAWYRDISNTNNFTTVVCITFN